jgi:flagellar biosynthesis component FlhA
MRYCSAAAGTLQELGVPVEALVSVSPLLTGQPGFWVPQEYWQLVASHNVDLLEEPLAFVVHHLEAVLRRNLAGFLGIQEVENMLQNWRESEADAALIERVLPDEPARLRFARLLRTLVREQVPITSRKEILVAAQDSGLGNLANAIRAARVRLKRELPGNLPSVRRFELPLEWGNTIDSWLKYRDGTSSFTPPGEQVHRLLLTVGELLRSEETNAALVVDNPEVRPYLWRLVERRFPHLMVLSKEEVVAPASPSV